MVTYPAVEIAQFIERENRFIAYCYLEESGEKVRVHVKNTGRCKELLIPGVAVALSYQAGAHRKTAYDLIGVKKENQWINIDSQVPNRLAYEGLESGELVLPGLKGNWTQLKKEVTFGSSRFDLYGETTEGEKVIIEVKGMTLANQKVGAFPDAPSLRALKHVEGLAHWRREGYLTYIVFIVQLAEVAVATIHREMQPALAEAIELGQSEGLKVIAQTCQVTPDKILLKDTIPFNLYQEFNNPNI